MTVVSLTVTLPLASASRWYWFEVSAIPTKLGWSML